MIVDGTILVEQILGKLSTAISRGSSDDPAPPYKGEGLGCPDIVIVHAHEDKASKNLLICDDNRYDGRITCRGCTRLEWRTGKHS